MKAIDFITEWDKTHTSQPSYQDVIDWVEKQHKIDIQKMENKSKVAIALEKQKFIGKACRWLYTQWKCPYYSEILDYTEIIEDFRQYMEEE